MPATAAIDRIAFIEARNSSVEALIAIAQHRAELAQNLGDKRAEAAIVARLADEAKALDKSVPTVDVAAAPPHLVDKTS